MKIILKLNGFVAVTAGFIVIFNPQLLLNINNPDEYVLVLSKLYGIAIFFAGIISFIISKSFEYNLMFKQILLCIISFHFVVGLFLYAACQQFLIPNFFVWGYHLSMSIIFLFQYLRKFQNFN